MSTEPYGHSPMEGMNEAQRLVNMERERRRAAGEPLLTEYEVERIMSRVPRGDGVRDRGPLARNPLCREGRALGLASLEPGDAETEEDALIRLGEHIMECRQCARAIGMDEVWR